MLQKVFICTPTSNRQLTADTSKSIFDIGQRLAYEGVTSTFKWYSSPDIVESRNELMAEWYNDTDASHILMIDSDMNVRPQMVWDMVRFNKCVVGAIYAKRQFPITAVGLALTDLKQSLDDTRSGFLQVDAVGGGVLLIARYVAEILGPEPFNRISEEGGSWLSEDLSFCIRWRNAGGEVWANIRHPVGHIGPHEWVCRYEDFMVAQEKADAL